METRVSLKLSWIVVDTLGASLLGNMLAGTGITRAGYGSKDLSSKKGKGIIRAGYGYGWTFNTSSSFN